MGAFSPTYDGVIEFATLPDDFTDRMARRVDSGLLAPGSRRRAQYLVRQRSADAITFGAGDFWTAYNIGLNEVELRRESSRRIAYHGSFPRWATYAAIHGFVITALILLGFLLWPGARAELSETSWGWPFYIALLALFGIAWPWILVALHRRMVPPRLEQIVREVASG